MYINLKEIYEDYPDDYDKICELLCKYMSKNPKKKANAELSLSIYDLPFKTVMLEKDII